MRIEIDLYRVNPELEKEITQDEVIFYATIKDRITTRLSLLKPEIDAEETEKESEGIYPFIEIVVLEEPTKVKFHHYSETLTKKMNESFNLNDGKLIDKKVEQNLKTRNN